MQWSQLKSRTEANFADAVRGRVEVWTTRYRRAHDQHGEAWITMDGDKVVTMGALRFEIAHAEESWRLRKERQCMDWRDEAQLQCYRASWDEAKQQLETKGTFADRHLKRALFIYLNTGIADALTSGNPIMRAFALLDRRFGKRRLAEFHPEGEHPLVQQFYRVRCQLEGVSFQLDSSHRMRQVTDAAHSA